MNAVPSSSICNRVRSQISQALDDQLSQLERAMLAGHLKRCPDCRAYEAELAAFTCLLRRAPLQQLENPIVVRRPRRAIGAKVQAAAAAAMAIVALGVASRMTSPESRSIGSSSVGQQVRNPSMGELQSELDFLRMVRPGKPLSRAHLGYVR